MRRFQIFNMALLFLLTTACKTELSENPERQPIVFEHELVLSSFGNANGVNQDCPESLPGKLDGRCGLYEVPLNWEHQNNDFIEVFLRQYPRAQAGNNGNTKGQLWLIDGGPGSSGLTFAQSVFVDLIHEMGWDLFIPTHRGVGFSTELTCDTAIFPLAQDVVQACGEQLSQLYGENLNWFSSLGAAYDLNYLIEINNPQGVPVVMVGASYGSFLTQRFIQLFESQLTAAVLLSGTNLDPKLENLARDEDQTFRRILAHCETQPDCSSMFLDSPVESAEKLILYGGWQHCSTSADDEQLISLLLRGMAMHPTLRNRVPLTIKQFSRCNQNDQIALNTLINEFREIIQTSNERPLQFNGVINTHQIIIELLSSEQQFSYPFLWPDNLLMGRSIEPILDVRDAWPSHSLPIAMPNRINTNLPVLLLHGSFDMQASKRLIEELNHDLTGEYQHSIMFPTAGHGTPSYTLDADGNNCSWDLIDKFLSAPKAVLDTSCVTDVIELIFVTE